MPSWLIHFACANKRGTQPGIGNHHHEKNDGHRHCRESVICWREQSREHRNGKKLDYHPYYIGEADDSRSLGDGFNVHFTWQ